jgi:Ni/Fe-hydrogenase subunit HybB-like protein
MTALTQEKRNIPLSWIILGLFTALGVGLFIYRLAVGLGPTTNLDNHYPWGLWITLDVFLIPIGGAAFTTSLISHFFEDERYHRIIRPAVLVGFLCYSLVGIILIADLGRWHQFYNFLIPGRINIHSFLWEVAFCVTFYTLILVLELAPTILERYGLQAPRQFLEKAMVIIAGAGVVLSSMHQSSIGHLFLLVPNRLHPLWWTPFIGLLYFIQALFGGLSMAAVILSLTWSGMKMKADKTLLIKMGKTIRAILLVYLGITTLGWALEGDLGKLFSSGHYSALLWAELILGAIVPLALLFSRFGSRRDGIVWAGLFVLVGIFLNRLTVSWLGLARPAWAAYAPHWMEIMMSVGFFAGALLFFQIIARYFRLFPEQR